MADEARNGVKSHLHRLTTVEAALTTHITPHYALLFIACVKTQMTEAMHGHSEGGTQDCSVTIISCNVM